MSQKNESLILVLAVVITASLLGVGYFFFSKSAFFPAQNPINPGNPSTNPSSVKVSDDLVENNISQGEKVLIPVGNIDFKQAGVAAFASGQYQQAVQNFNAALQQNRNDPETLIYKNNAQILQSNQKFYAIAVSVPIGTSLNSAQEILRGVAQAQEEVNTTGGINNQFLKVMIANDNNNPDLAKAIAQTFVNNPEILGVIGNFGSDVTLASASVYESGQLVLISPTSTSTQITNAGNYIFRTVPSDRFSGSTLARYLLNTLNLKKAVIFYNRTNDYSTSLQTEFTTAYTGEGGEIVSAFDLSQTNFNGINALETSRQQQAEAIILTPDSSTLEQALQVVRVNRKQLPILAGDSVYKPETLKVGSDATGMIIAIPWHILATENSAFSKDAIQRWGGDVNWRTAMAYDATKVFIKALSENPTRTGIQQILSQPGFSVEGATGTIRFLPSGDRNQALQLVTIEAGKRSGFGYDFIPLP